MKAADKINRFPLFFIIWMLSSMYSCNSSDDKHKAHVTEVAADTVIKTKTSCTELWSYGGVLIASSLKTTILIEPDNSLHAVDNESGKELWVYKTEHGIEHSSGNNTDCFILKKIFIDKGLGNLPRVELCAVDLALGNEKWKFNTDGSFADLKIKNTTENNIILLAHTTMSYEDTVSLINLDAKTGKVIWSFLLDKRNMVKTEIAQSKNNLIVFTDNKTLQDDGYKNYGKLTCLDLSSGNQKWQVIDSTGTHIENSNEDVVVVSQFYNPSVPKGTQGFHGFDIENGALLSKYDFNNNQTFIEAETPSTSILMDSILYVVTTESSIPWLYVSAINMKNGTVLWKYNVNENLNTLKNIWNEHYPLSSWPLASPLLHSGENIFVLTPHSIVSINRFSGKEIWLHRDDTPIVNVTNLSISNGKLFFGRYYGSDMSNTAFLSVLDALSGKEIFSNEKGPWPFKSNDYFDQNYFNSIDNLIFFSPSKTTVTAYKAE